MLIVDRRDIVVLPRISIFERKTVGVRFYKCEGVESRMSYPTSRYLRGRLLGCNIDRLGATS